MSGSLTVVAGVHAARHAPGGPDSLEADYVPLEDGALAGDLDAGGNRITDVDDPDDDGDVATKGWTLAQLTAPAVVALGDMGAAQTLPDPLWNQMVTGTLTADCTVTPGGAVAGAQVLLAVTQDDTGGRSLTWDGVRWADDTAPDLAGTAGAVSYFQLVCSDGSHWDGLRR